MSSSTSFSIFSHIHITPILTSNATLAISLMAVSEKVRATLSLYEIKEIRKKIMVKVSVKTERIKSVNNYFTIK